MPLFSIAIPTRNRAMLARRAMSCVFAQSFADWELIVLDNSDDSDVLLDDRIDSRCLIMHSVTTLSMPDNWERALDYSTGEYLMFLSDKDMLLPSALSRIFAVISEDRPKIISFRKAGVVEGAAGFVQACSGRITRELTRPALETWFHGVRHQHNAPMVYNSAVRRDFLLRLRRNGRFFVGCAPDIASGIILSSAADSYTLLDRPLVVSLYGEWSIGRAAGSGSRGAAQRWLAEFDKNPLQRVGIVDGVVGAVAETLLSCKNAYPTELRSWRIRWRTYVRNVLWDVHARRSAGTTTDLTLRELRQVRGAPYSKVHLALGYAQYWFERVKASDKLLNVRKQAIALFKGLGAQPSRRLQGSSRLDESNQVRTRDVFNGPEPVIGLAHYVATESSEAISPNYVTLDHCMSFQQAFSLVVAINEELDVRSARNDTPTKYKVDVRMDSQVSHSLGKPEST